MVDALRRANALRDAGGAIIEIHPTPEPAHLEIAIGSAFVRLADRLDDGTASGPRARHEAAGAAVAACVSAGLFSRDAATDFTFRTYADTVDELVEYLGAKWKQLHFADPDMLRARERLARHNGSTVVVTERVAACRLAGPPLE